jgi:hypothetical protein
MTKKGFSIALVRVKLLGWFVYFIIVIVWGE